MNNSQKETIDEREIVDFDRVEFWIHRLLEEKIQQQKKICDEIGILNHQAQHFKQMPKCAQNLVIDKLNNHFISLKWKYKIKEEE